jgi:undecaprenyl phosphate-alpha-L-ara4N flippase subunit ArnE
MRLVIGFILMIGCTVAANLFLKLGAQVPMAERTIVGVMDWRAIVGFAFFGAGGLIYSWILNWMPLNVAQSIAASQFVAVIIASAWLLGEPISVPRVLGIGLIVAGIVLVSATYGRAPVAGAAAATITTDARS